MSKRFTRSIDLARWLQPGLGVKRWLLLAAVGATLFVNGVSRYLTDEGITLEVNELVDSLVAEFFPPGYLSYVFMIAGALLVALGIWKWLNAIVTAVAPHGTSNVIDAIRERRLERGYRIVVVGGGTGLSTMLRGLKKIHHQPHRGRDRQRRRRFVGTAAKRARRASAGRHSQLPRRARRRRSARHRALPLSLLRRRRAQRTTRSGTCSSPR